MFTYFYSVGSIILFLWVFIKVISFFSAGKLPKAYIPPLATMAQSAKKEAPASDAVSRSLAAACLWLMSTSQPGKVPEGMWNVLGDLKVTQSTSQHALPNWLKDCFLLTASPNGE